jgi:hypothetical protein
MRGTRNHGDMCNDDKTVGTFAQVQLNLIFPDNVHREIALCILPITALIISQPACADIVAPPAPNAVLPCLACSCVSHGQSSCVIAIVLSGRQGCCEQYLRESYPSRSGSIKMSGGC